MCRGWRLPRSTIKRLSPRALFSHFLASGWINQSINYGNWQDCRCRYERHIGRMRGSTSKIATPSFPARESPRCRCLCSFRTGTKPAVTVVAGAHKGISRARRTPPTVQLSQRSPGWAQSFGFGGSDEAPLRGCLGETGRNNNHISGECGCVRETARFDPSGRDGPPGPVYTLVPLTLEHLALRLPCLARGRAQRITRSTLAGSRPITEPSTQNSTITKSPCCSPDFVKPPPPSCFIKRSRPTTGKGGRRKSCGSPLPKLRGQTLSVCVDQRAPVEWVTRRNREQTAVSCTCRRMSIRKGHPRQHL